MRVALAINGFHIFRRDLQEPRGPYPQEATESSALRCDGTDEVTVAVRGPDGATYLAVAKLERIA